ncbi:MAG TPA: CYTH domain-containing protein [Planctomycetota bacterium]
MTALEREFKVRLAPGAYQALAARLADWPARRAQQSSRFFDTPQRSLRAARLALRLRAEDGRFAVALKGPALPAADGLAVRAELERTVEEQAARAVLAGERSALELFGSEASPLLAQARALVAGAPLGSIGGFENERLSLGPRALAPGTLPVVLELDRTRFPDGSLEHELELELPEEADAAGLEHALRALCASLAIPFETAPSKAARCFRILDRMAAGGAPPAST